MHVSRSSMGARQLLDPTARHGVTPFMDLSEKEFADHYLGLVSLPGHLQLKKGETLPTDDLPDEIDWREKGAVSPVKNQGMCGSCYAFSTVGAVEGALFLRTQKLANLSTQQIVDCDHQCDPAMPQVCDNGCGGGMMSNTMEYIIRNGGIDTEESYPYEGRPGPCRAERGTVGARLKDFVLVPKDEEQMAAHLVQSGPLAIALNAGWMQTYVRGVSCPLVCIKDHLNHGVLLVGYGAQGFAPSRLGPVPYWIIKNSWGPKWGENGYIRMCRGKDMCGIDSMVLSAVIADGDE
eukprot:jgi/Mesvir1/5916/Mv00685-RA.1